MQHDTSEDLDESKDRKGIERSAAYPAITLEDAIQYAVIVAKNFPGGKDFDRGDIQAILDKTGVNRDVAACVHYGLFAKREKKYYVTDVLKKIQYPINEPERIKTLKTCFNTPKLFKDLIEKFDGQPLPTELKVHLVRFHAIAERAADHAANVFIHSGEYCHAIKDGILDWVELTEAARRDLEKEKEYTTFEPVTEVKKKPPPVMHQLPQVPDDQEQVKIPLTGGKTAYLSYPKNITAKDVKILSKQIEALELIVSND
ncbi:MAG TPA: hypothetical protein VK508_18230 [Cyclobacteriaceae bacterium]|nr:hypothetical protein [Cyclobacteriaceae bacterium]